MPAAKSKTERDHLFKQNMGLVHKIAKLYIYTTLPSDDMIQEGYLGLLRASDKFEPERGFRFSTYACWWIRAYITRAIQMDKVAKVPEWAQIQRGLAKRAMAAHREKNGGEWPAVDEVLDDIRQVGSRETTRQILQCSFAERSMDEDISHDGGVSLHNVIVDEKAPNPENVVDARLQIEDLVRRLGELSPRERIIIKARLGLDNGRWKTLQAIGDQLGLSRERVRQIEKKGLAELGIERPKRRRRKAC